MSKPLSLSFLTLLLLLSSCGGPKKRCATPKELARELLSAIQENDEKKFLALYPTKKECMDIKDDLIEEDAVKTTYSKYDNGDRGLSESDVEEYFEDNRAKARKCFKSLIADGKDNDIKWEKAKVESVRLPRDSKMKRGDEPGWMYISLKTSDHKKFWIRLYNTFKTPQGWHIGLECEMDDYVIDNSDLFDRDEDSDDDDNSIIGN